MNKILKNLVFILMLVCTISSISFAEVTITRPKEAKGTILGGNGTEQNPYQLVMGEGLIDIYYVEETDVREIYFKFVKGYNAGNYLVENNADKKRIRFTLIGTDESSLRVTPYEGENYLQAGAVTTKLEVYSDYKNMQKPLYQIIALEQIGKKEYEFDMANGYLNESLISNVSAYGTSYVFSKSGLPFNTAYVASSEEIESARKKADSSKTVTVTYCFKGTTTESTEEEATGWIERLASKIIMSFGDMFVKISKIGGSNVTSSYVSIDSLVFNEYPNTIVNFFGDTNYLNEKAQGIIKVWYNIFKAWAIIAYILLLIYIGIKVVLYSGTAEQKKYKGMLEGWLQGVLILFIMPFFFKYMIEINDVLVDIIRTNSKHSIYSYYSFEHLYENDKEDGEDTTTTVLVKLTKEEKYLKEKIDDLEEEKKNIEEHLDSEQDILEALNNNYEENNIVVKYYLEQLERSKVFIANYLKENNIQIVFNGKVLTVDKLERVISQFAKEFYSKKENRDRIMNAGEFTNAINKDEIFKDELAKQFQIQKVGGGNLEESIKEYVEKNILKEFGVSIAYRDCYDLIIEVTKAEHEEKKKEIEEKQLQIEKINEAIEIVKNNDADILGNMRSLAGRTYKFLYAIIWIVMVFQIIFLLILYYKRLFILMVLIIIFPLICVAYVYEKSKGGKAKILSNWIQEYIVNIFIQSVHAILYVTIVEAGYSVYLADDQNWLIYFIAVISLLTSEAVFKNLLGMQASTVADLAQYGSAAMKIGSTVVVAGASAIGGLRNKMTGSVNSAIDFFAGDKSEKLSKAQQAVDKRTETIRKIKENRIKRSRKLTEAQKKAKLDKKHNAEQKRDKLKLKHRKIARGAKKTFKVVKKAGRDVVKGGALMGTVAGGLAAGGEFGDFMKASSVAKGIIGKDKKTEASEDHIGKIKNKIKGAFLEDKPTTTNAGMVDTSVGSSSGGNEIPGGVAVETSNPMVSHPETRKEARLANSFRDRLQEQNVFIRKNYDIEEEDKEG